MKRFLLLLSKLEDREEKTAGSLWCIFSVSSGTYIVAELFWPCFGLCHNSPSVLIGHCHKKQVVCFYPFGQYVYIAQFFFSTDFWNRMDRYIRRTRMVLLVKTFYSKLYSFWKPIYIFNIILFPFWKEAVVGKPVKPQCATNTQFTHKDLQFRSLSFLPRKNLPIWRNKVYWIYLSSGRSVKYFTGKWQVVFWHTWLPI